jgi:hypothetical protein
MFDIALQDLLRIRRADALELSEKRKSILTYFEDELFIHLYLPDEYIIYHTVFKKGGTFFDGEGTEHSEESFRLSVLGGAIELVNPPREKELKIRIEQ